MDRRNASVRWEAESVADGLCIVEQPCFEMWDCFPERRGERQSGLTIKVAGPAEFANPFTGTRIVRIECGHQTVEFAIARLSQRIKQLSAISTAGSALMQSCPRLEISVDDIAKDPFREPRHDSLVARPVCDKQHMPGYGFATKPVSVSLYHTSPSMNSSRKTLRRSESTGCAVRLPSGCRSNTSTWSCSMSTWSSKYGE